ncbi:hypothetical protein QJQ45_016227 [Haematococcus lacustris]|nr:hypothetical protein QJQ45_016227 [Haematococcus lacustris]
MRAEVQERSASVMRRSVQGSGSCQLQPAASEPGPSTPLPAKRSKRIKAEPAAEPNKAQGRAAKAKPAPQPGRWVDRDCNAALNMQRIGESKWRPLELCYWPEQGALPAKGKEYFGLGYKRLRDEPPKAQPAEAQMPAIHLRWAARDKYLWMSLLAEFVGTALFQLLGATSADNPLQSAFSLGAIMYATKYISGGHLNPAVSLAALMSGHIDYVRGLAYIAAQMLGAVGGAVMQAFLSPDSEMGKLGPGCFAPMKSLTNWGLFGWETLLTFLFIAVMYAAIFVRPGHGDAAPLAAALALFAALSTDPSAMENLREGLLGGASAVAGEPTGSTFAPTGHHYAGSVITDAPAHGV